LNETQPPRRIGRSILAMVVGALVGILLSVGTDAVCHAIGVFPPPGQPMSDGLFLLATIYRTIYSILGSYIVASLAPHRPMWHAMAVGLVGLAAGAAGTIAMWNNVVSIGHHWYPLTLVALALPTAWAGAKLWELRSRSCATS
jgi:hypothetical protein